jgi:hypothetical protein
MENFIVSTVRAYKIHLLRPDDWFSLWRLGLGLGLGLLLGLVLRLRLRLGLDLECDSHPNPNPSPNRLNCRLVSYHSYLTKAEGYKQEDKWTFLTEGRDLNVPVSPFITG